MKRGVLLLLMQFAVPLTSAWSQSSFDMSPDAQTGERVLGSYFATDIDTVSMTNGNLHLNIPIFDLPGREVPLRLSMSYNSKFFEPRSVWTGYTWVAGYDFLGWRKDAPATAILTGMASYNTIDAHHRDCVGTLYLVDSNGTKHSLTKTLVTQTDTEPGWGGQWRPDCTFGNQTFDSTDSDLLRIETGNYFDRPVNADWGSAIVRFKNGTHLVMFTRTTDQCGEDGCQNTMHYKSELRTLNGNRLATTEDTENTTANGTRLRDTLPLTDTVGRTITYSKSANAESITLRDSNNQTKTYTLNWTNINGRRDPDTVLTTFRVVQSIVLPNGRSYQFTYNSNGYLDRVTFPSGAYVRYTYQVPDGRVGWYVSSRIVSADGTAAAEKVWTYSWPNPATVNDPSGGKTIHYFDSNGLETKTETATSGGTVLKQVVRTYEDSPAGKRMTDETTRQGEFSFSTSYTYDDHNNITSQTDSDATGPVREIDRTYLTSSTYTDWHIWDRPLSETVKQYPGPTQIAQTQWEYDTGTSVARSGTIPGWAIATGQVCVTLWDCGWYTSCSQVPLPRGNVTTVKRWLNTTNSYLITTNQYDTLGNLVKVTDPGAHETNIDFTDRFTDSISRNSFAYATRKTDAVGFYVDTTYDFNTGLVKQTTDSMSRTTTATYDLMNRDTQINLPNGGRTTYTYDDTTPKTTKEVLVDASNNVGRVITTFDKLYRVIKTETVDPAGNIFVDTQYDGNGRKWKVSNPYRTGDSVFWTTFTYDAMNRPAVTTQPDSSTIQYAYANNQTTVTDEAGNARRYSYDRFGQMTKVEEPNPTLNTPLVTTYTYNVLGKLTQTQQGSQTRTFVYDSLSRMTSQTLPESGTTTFVYNSDDLMTSKTDARGIITTMVYNSIHKLTSRTYSDATPAVGFQYDTAGRRTQMTDGLGTVNYAYVTNTDRLQQEQRTLTGITGTFTTSYAYNIKGDMTQMIYPSGRIVNFNYATGGGCCNSRLDSVTDQTTSTTVVGSLAYNPGGAMTSRTLGNGVVEIFGYNNRQQETSIVASRSGTTLMNFAYDYGTSTTNTGRVLARTDAIQPEHSAKYIYDPIYRLSQTVAGDATSSWAISWTFDIWGNRLTQTPQGIVVGKIGTQTLGYMNNRNIANTYDAVGNQTNDGLHNYTFNAENQITQMDAGTATYAYDGEGRRMKKTYNGETTYTFYDSKGNVISEFTTSNTIATATAASSTDRCFYHTTDKLGSAVLVISSAGMVIENNRTLPYGEAWLAESTTSTNDKKFTTYQRDQESGLDYAMARYSQSNAGRFLSSDPSGKSVHLSEPRTWNRICMSMTILSILLIQPAAAR